MTRRGFVKGILVAGVSLGLLVLLGMIQGIVGERQHRQRDVEADIAASLAGPQTLAGPILVVPYQVREAGTAHWHSKRLIIAPEKLAVDGRAEVAQKRRGIFAARTFDWRGDFDATFRIPVRLGVDSPKLEIRAEPGFLAFGVSDVRGVAADTELRWNGQPLATVTGTRDAPLGQGFHAVVGPLLTGEAQEVAAKLRLHVKGVARLAIAPAGKTTTVRLDSAWPHPSFFGRALPDTRPPGAAPFPATWSVSHLANSTSARLESGSKPEDRADGGPGPDAFGVAFLDPVNIYSQSERSVKYGILFIGLTFAAFLLYEALAGLLLHPLQYALVGLALALFYLLLLSLAEQIGFAPAYLAAALAAVALITYYLAPVLGNWRRALGAGAGLGVLFAALYGLLRSEDQALLLGSVLVFGLLALVMALTRRIDWYGLRGGAPASR